MSSDPSSDPSSDADSTEPIDASPEPVAERVPSRRQTLSFLQQMLAANGLTPRKRYGQNFLIDLNLLELIVRHADPTPESVVLEIGAGAGSLTTRLARRAGRVVTVEIDNGLLRLLKAETASLPNVTLLHADALENKNRINPLVMATLAEATSEVGSDGYQLAANLPYDISASVVANLLLEDAPIRRLTITVQQEMGERIAASPGSRDYGPLAVLVQRVAEVEWVRTLPPAAFWPRPKVHSCILDIRVDPSKRADLSLLREWNGFVRTIFLHRRKTLRAVLGNLPDYKAKRDRLDGLLADFGHDADARAERLSPDELMSLYLALKA